MTLISAPFERLKILLQVQGQNLQENRHYKKAPSSAMLSCVAYTDKAASDQSTEEA